MLDIIRKDLKEAMKAGNKIKLNALRNLVAKIKATEIDKGELLTDEETMKVCMSSAKQIKESIKQFKNAGRDDLVKDEESELEIIQNYLPQQLSEEQLTIKIRTVIKEQNAQSAADMGKIMGPLMKELAGTADGKIVQNIVIKELNK